MASLVEKLDQKLTCAICLEQYKEPKVLACLHSYCKGCLQKLVKTGRPSTITCPECRQVTKLSSEDVNTLQTNFFINNILEVMALEGTTEKKHGKRLTCENCDTNDEAVTRCKLCCVFLCEFCTQSHRRARATNQHRLMTIEEVKAAGPSALTKPLLCLKHKQETLKLFCITCDIPICRDCIIIDHKDHKYAFVEGIFMEQKQAIMKSIELGKKNISSLTTAISGIENVEKSLENKAARIEKEIDNFISGLAEALEKKRKSLKEDLRMICEKKKNNLKSQKEKLSLPLGTFQSFVMFAEDVLRKCDDTEILSLKKQISQSFDEVHKKTGRIGSRPCETQNISLVLNKEQDIHTGIAKAAAIKTGSTESYYGYVVTPTFQDVVSNPWHDYK